MAGLGNRCDVPIHAWPSSCVCRVPVRRTSLHLIHILGHDLIPTLTLGHGLQSSRPPRLMQLESLMSTSESEPVSAAVSGLDQVAR